MTISSEVRKAGPYDGNDVTTSFPFSFKVFSADDVVVVLTDPAGIETTLTGSGTDVDNDPLTYMWEQNDVGGATGTALLNNVKKDGPLFRQFGVAAQVTPEDTLKSPSPGENVVTSNPTRVFPDMAQILAGNTNAATGTCPPGPSGCTARAAARGARARATVAASASTSCWSWTRASAS